MLRFVDTFFVVFHTLLIVFIMSGWVWAKTRRLHLVVTIGTCLSWFGLGIFYGWGYCPSTDWHWKVKRALGETALPNSYVKYYLDRLTDSPWNPRFVDTSVLVLGLAALGVSVWMNRLDRNRQRAAEPAESDA